jgi:hypothetical protein
MNFLSRFNHTSCLALSLFVLGTAAHASTLTFDLNGSLAANENAAISLTALGGSLGATGYTFAAGQGLSINLGAVPSSYSIDMKFEFSPLGAGFSKILDFSNLVSDAGLYTFSSNISLFPSASAISGFAGGVINDVLITRSAAGLVSVSLNGVPQITGVTDPTGSYNGSILTFFADDAATSHVEQSPGFVDSITIATNLTSTSAVPEPSTWAMMMLGFAGIGFMAYRRKQDGSAFRAARCATSPPYEKPMMAMRSPAIRGSCERNRKAAYASATPIGR